MLPITALLIDPRNPIRPTATVITLTPDLATFYRLLDCRMIGGLTLRDGNALVYVDEPISHHYHNVVGGPCCVLHRDWANPVCGPVIITGPIDGEGEHTALHPRDCHTVARQFMGGWVASGFKGLVKVVTRLTML